MATATKKTTAAKKTTASDKKQEQAKDAVDQVNDRTDSSGATKEGKSPTDPTVMGGDTGEQNLIDSVEHPVRYPAHTVRRGIFDKPYLDDQAPGEEVLGRKINPDFPKDAPQNQRSYQEANSVGFAAPATDSDIAPGVEKPDGSKDKSTVKDPDQS